MWTEKINIAVPSIHRDLANKAAFLFDPNLRGDLTFPEGEEYSTTRTQLKKDFVGLFERPRDVDTWFSLLQQKAQEKGVEEMTREEVETLCDVLLFDEECPSEI